jgi:hypothetical protein
MMSARKLLLKPFLLAALVFTVYSGQPAAQEAAAEGRSTISARIAWRAAYFIDDVQELDSAEPVDLTGDFVIGDPLTPVKPDLEKLAQEQPELLSKLEEIGHVPIRAILDKAGRLTNLRFEEEIDPAVRDLFVETLRDARFEPTVHFERGPVFVQIGVDYVVESSKAPALIPEEEALKGEEVGVVQRVMTDTEEGVPHEAPLQRYASILYKPDMPLVPESDTSFLASFFVIVDSRGVVKEARLFSDSRDHRPPSKLANGLPSLRSYLEGFRFEPQYLSDGSPARFAALVDLRVSPGRVEIATRETGSESDAEARFSEVYWLDEGRVLDLLLPPHPPERMLLYRNGNPGQARLIPSGPDQMFIYWEDDRPKYGEACFGCTGLKEFILPQLGIPGYNVRLGQILEEVRVEVDVLMRPGATTDELLADLEAALREKLGLDLSFDLQTEMRPTLVLEGSIGEVAQDPSSGRPTLHAFTDTKEPEGSAGPCRDAKHLAEILESELGMAVVDQAESATNPFWIALHRSAFRTERLDLLIRNLEAQTDLEIRVEKRPTEVLYLTQRQGT